MLAIELEKAEGEGLQDFLRDPEIETIMWKRWSDVGNCLITSTVSRMTDEPAVMPVLSPYTFTTEYRNCHWWEATVTIGDQDHTSTMAVPVDDKVYTTKEAIEARKQP